MTERRVGRVFLDRDHYVTNRSRFPLEELLRYRGQWVAWSSDGSRVVAHHEDLHRVAACVTDQGIASDEVILERIPEEGELTLL